MRTRGHNSFCAWECPWDGSQCTSCSLTHSHSHSLPHIIFTHSHCHPFTLTGTHSLTLKFTFTRCLIHSHSQHTQHSHSHSQVHTHSLSHIHTHTHSHVHSHTHTLSLIHSHTRAIPQLDSPHPLPGGASGGNSYIVNLGRGHLGSLRNGLSCSWSKRSRMDLVWPPGSQEDLVLKKPHRQKLVICRQPDTDASEQCSCQGYKCGHVRVEDKCCSLVTRKAYIHPLLELRSRLMKKGERIKSNEI